MGVVVIAVRNFRWFRLTLIVDILKLLIGGVFGIHYVHRSNGRRIQLTGMDCHCESLFYARFAVGISDLASGFVLQ